MKKLSYLFKNLVLVTLPSLLLLFLLLELIFRFLIPASAFPVGYFEEETAIFKFNSNPQTGTFTAGKFAQQRGNWTINNHGWNSPINYDDRSSDDRKRIAVIGDSYVEAIQVDSDKTFTSILQDSLQAVADVYAFGKSGAPFSQYLYLSRYLNERYNPDVFVFTLIHNDFAESIYTDNPNQRVWMTLDLSDTTDIQEVMPQDDPFTLENNTWKKLLVKSAFVRYLYYNLRAYELVVNWRTKQATYNANVEVDELKAARGEVKLAIDYICQQLQKELVEQGKEVVFVMTASLQDIHANRTLDESNIWFLHEMMAAASAKYNISYVDLSYPLQRDFKENNLPFHSPYDGHWNEYGHQKVAAILYPYLNIKLAQ